MPKFKKLQELVDRLNLVAREILTGLPVIRAFNTEKYIGRKADKNRKIYNGMLKTYFYQFLGPKPPKKRN